MDLPAYVIFLLCVAYFVAGFIDSIAGGGGLITLPSLLFAGFPPQFALGTNKMASTFGTGTAVFNFIKEKKINWKIIAYGFAFSLMGAYLGSRLILYLNQEIIGKIIMFLLPIGIIATIIPKRGNKYDCKLLKLDYIIKIPAICLCIGFYDGFFGPGTGSFLALSFYFIIHLKLIDATANTKVFNFISNVVSFLTFLVSGKILVFFAIPFAVSNMIGNYLGSKMAIKKGEYFIKIILVFVLILLLISFLYKYY